jgi:hypothetical protein
MKNFIIVQDAIIHNVLGPAEENIYNLLGYQSPKRASGEVDTTGVIVQCYYLRSSFPKNKGSEHGPVTNEVTYQVDITVNSEAKADVSVIDDPLKTDAEKGRAIENAVESGLLADSLLNKVIAYVYDVLMATKNFHFGLSESQSPIGSRWVQRVEKDRPRDGGEQITLSASVEFIVSMAEDIPGEVGKSLVNIDNTIDIEGDNVEKTGVLVSA